MSTWLGFAVTFVGRPFGGLVLGVVGDIFGRKAEPLSRRAGVDSVAFGDGSKPCTLVNIKIAGKWMFTHIISYYYINRSHLQRVSEMFHGPIFKQMAMDQYLLIQFLVG